VGGFSNRAGCLMGPNGHLSGLGPDPGMTEDRRGPRETYPNQSALIEVSLLPRSPKCFLGSILHKVCVAKFHMEPLDYYQR
jgi:hypothetical protein